MEATRIHNEDIIGLVPIVAGGFQNSSNSYKGGLQFKIIFKFFTGS